MPYGKLTINGQGVDRIPWAVDDKVSQLEKNSERLKTQVLQGPGQGDTCCSESVFQKCEDIQCIKYDI